MSDSNDVEDRYGFREIIEQKDREMREAIKLIVYEHLMTEEAWKYEIRDAVKAGKNSCDVNVNPNGPSELSEKIEWGYYDEDEDWIVNQEIFNLVKSHVSKALAGSKITLKSVWIDEDGDYNWRISW